MAAGLGFKTFTTGEVLTAADTNGYLMQGINVFASTAARDAAITSPQEGQFAYTKDTNSLWYYTGSAWAASGATGDIEGVTAGVGITGGGTSGTVTITNDMATTITAAGDIVVGTGSGTYDNLPIGTTAQVLTADTTVSPYKVKWATPATASFVGVSLTNNAAISLANATDTKVTWNTEKYDTSAFHTGTSSAVIIPSGLAGKYLITGCLTFDANTAGQRYIITKVNGVEVAANQDSAGSVGGVPKAWCFTNVVNLAVSDSIEFHAYQSSGGSLNLLFTGGYVTNVQITYMGA